MLRIVGGAARAVFRTTVTRSEPNVLRYNVLSKQNYHRSFSVFAQQFNALPTVYTKNVTSDFPGVSSSLLQPNTALSVPARTLTKFSLQKGKRKTVKAVIKRFKRLHWGGWIRTIAGRFHYRWRKSNRQKQRFKHHVMCNGKQNWLLDTMVTNFWRRPKYYVDDPYAPYHKRDYYKCKTGPFK